MLFQSPDAAAPVRLQGCFVSDGELQKLISYWQTARRTQFIGAPGSGVAGGEGRVASSEGRVVLPAPNLDAAPTTVSPTARTRPGDVPPPVVHLNPPEPVGGPPPPQRRAPRIPTAPATSDERRVTSSESGEWRVAGGEPNERPATNDQRPTTHTHPADGITQQPLWEALQAMDDEASNGNGEDDDLLPEAIALVRSLNKASTSLLQRRFRIGYTRAARLMDALEDAGIIGPPTGTSKAREVFGGGEAASDANPADEPDSETNDAQTEI
jgi:S-DNA-T family DNA segregation ATPase FtsK/SpoIIIE